jgi:molecular chaperone GrpE
MSDDTKPQDDPAVAEELKGVPEELLDNASPFRWAASWNRCAKSSKRPSRKCSMPRPRRRTCAAAWKRTSPMPAPMPRPVCPRYPFGGRQPGARARFDPGRLREDDRLKALIAGIEATSREIDKVFGQHGISRIAAVGLPLDPNQHQAMLEMPSGIATSSRSAEPGTGLVQELHWPAT